jgi:hypothetical protein
VRTALIVGGAVAVVAGGAAWWWWRRSRSGAAIPMTAYQSIDRSEAGGGVAPDFYSPPPNALMIAAQQAARWAEDAPPPPPAANCGEGFHWEPGALGGFGQCVRDAPPPQPAQQPPAPKKKKGFFESIGSGVVDIGKAVVGAAVKVEKVQIDQFKKGAALTGADKKIPGYDAGIAKVDGVVRSAA